jgi:hypothetical protein
MAQPISKSDFLADLRTRSDQHRRLVTDTFQPLDDATLAWQPDPREWNILQCFEHNVQTHDYYAPKIAWALQSPSRSQGADEIVQPSFWGRIYMHFAFNPRYSFPTTAAITPHKDLDRAILDMYLRKQDDLSAMLDQAEPVDLSRTAVPLEKGIRFNLGDCLKILVYHDGLHIDQAQRVLEAYQPA